MQYPLDAGAAHGDAVAPQRLRAVVPRAAARGVPHHRQGGGDHGAAPHHVRQVNQHHMGSSILDKEVVSNTSTFTLLSSWKDLCYSQVFE